MVMEIEEVVVMVMVMLVTVCGSDVCGEEDARSVW